MATTTPPLPIYPSGDPVIEGYPRIVNIASIDRRLGSWFEGKVNDAGDIVAVAPGVYTPYSDLVPDLLEYLDTANSGDCAVRKRFFPSTGGACWEGVQPGSEEP